MITPVELSNKSFSKSGLGYDKKDVDAFMRDVTASYEMLYKENVELKDKVNVLNEGIQYYKTIEKTIQKALVLAEQTAEETRETARKNANAIEEKAKVKASLYLEDAKKQLNDIHQKTVQLIQQYEVYKSQFKNLASAQIEILSSDAFQIEVANLESFIQSETSYEGQESTANEKSEETKQEMDQTSEMNEFHLPIENI